MICASGPIGRSKPHLGSVQGLQKLANDTTRYLL